MGSIQAGIQSPIRKLTSHRVPRPYDRPKSLNCGFKKPGPHAMNHLRAVLISGPPGIGKTTTAHLVSRLEGYTPIELNASDTRSKKLIESSLKETINNTSLDGWYSGGVSSMSAFFLDSELGFTLCCLACEQALDKTLSADGIKVTDRTVLIMDEVDGMSGGDRGGVGAINALIKKTKVSD